MEKVFRNLPVLLVFLTMAAYAWIFGGSRAQALVPTIPWLWAFLMEALLFFPQRRPHEDAVSARRRAWRGMGRDPLLYLSLGFVALLLVPFVNTGLCEVCDYAQIREGASPQPPLPFAPFCVNAAEHFGVVVWFVPALTAMLAARHALLRSGRRALVEMIAWNAAALAAFGFVQQATGAAFPFWTERPSVSGETHFFSTFGYPNMGGSFFVMAFAFSVGVWQHRAAEVESLPPVDRAKSLKEQALHRWLRAHYPLAAVALNFLGAMATLCRAALLLLFALAALAFLYHVGTLFAARRAGAQRVRRLLFAAGGLLLFLLGACVFAPDGLSRELSSLSSQRVLGRGKDDYHARLALDIFRDHPLFGVGGWGYRHFGRAYFERLTLDHLLPCSKVTGVARDEEGRACGLFVETPDGKTEKAGAVVVDVSAAAALPRGELAARKDDGEETPEARPLADLLRVGTAGEGYFQPNPRNRRKYADPQRGFVRMRDPDGRPFDKEVALRFVKCADVEVEEVRDEARRLSGLRVALRDGRRVDVAAVAVERAKRNFQDVGGANVHNDYLQFLCEHGAVGAALLAAIFLCLAVPVVRSWVRLCRTARFLPAEKAPPWPRALYCLPAGTLWILLGNAALMVHAFGDCPMRSAAVLSTFLVTLACADGFLPHEAGRR